MGKASVLKQSTWLFELQQFSPALRRKLRSVKTPMHYRTQHKLTSSACLINAQHQEIKMKIDISHLIQTMVCRLARTLLVKALNKLDLVGGSPWSITIGFIAENILSWSSSAYMLGTSPEFKILFKSLKKCFNRSKI